MGSLMDAPLGGGCDAPDSIPMDFKQFFPQRTLCLAQDIVWRLNENLSSGCDVDRMQTE
jgi:hypothetical protein